MSKHKVFLETLDVSGLVFDIVKKEKGFDEFVNAYREKYNEEITLDELVRTAIDTVNMIAEVLRYSESKENTEELKRMLDGMQMAGYSGLIRFDENGDISRYRVWRLRQGEFQPIQK